MMIHWMMNNPWPSFFGHLFDDYFKQGGGYFGAKKGLRPLNVVWDYYATGDRSQAKVYVVNQTAETRDNLRVAVEFFNLDGNQQYFSEVGGFSIAAKHLPRSHDRASGSETGLYTFRARGVDDRNARSAGGERVLGIHHGR